MLSQGTGLFSLQMINQHRQPCRTLTLISTAKRTLTDSPLRWRRFAWTETHTHTQREREREREKLNDDYT